MKGRKAYHGTTETEDTSFIEASDSSETRNAEAAKRFFCKNTCCASYYCAGYMGHPFIGFCERMPYVASTG